MVNLISKYLKVLNVKLNFQEHAKGIRVDLIFVDKDKKAGFDITPFSIIGNPETVENELKLVFTTLEKRVGNSIDNISFFEKQIKAKEEASKAKATGKKTKAAVEVKKVEEKKAAVEPDLFAQPKKSAHEIMKEIDKKEAKKEIPKPIAERPVTPQEAIKKEIVEKSGIPADNIIVTTTKPTERAKPVKRCRKCELPIEAATTESCIYPSCPNKTDKQIEETVARNQIERSLDSKPSDVAAVETFNLVPPAKQIDLVEQIDEVDKVDINQNQPQDEVFKFVPPVVHKKPVDTIENIEKRENYDSLEEPEWVTQTRQKYDADGNLDISDFT